jgi:hypothetical protein
MSVHGTSPTNRISSVSRPSNTMHLSSTRQLRYTARMISIQESKDICRGTQVLGWLSVSLVVVILISACSVTKPALTSTPISPEDIRLNQLVAESLLHESDKQQYSSLLNNLLELLAAENEIPPPSDLIWSDLVALGNSIDDRARLLTPALLDIDPAGACRRSIGIMIFQIKQVQDLISAAIDYVTDAAINLVSDNARMTLDSELTRSLDLQAYLTLARDDACKLAKEVG